MRRYIRKGTKLVVIGGIVYLLTQREFHFEIGEKKPKKAQNYDVNSHAPWGRNK